MRQRFLLATLVAAIAGVGMSDSALHGDEGMWLYSNAPKEYLKKKYGFEPSDAWLDHLRQASVRFNSGGSGSFVSANGLVMTNHHVGADDLQKLSDEKNDYLKNGFHAKTMADEKACKGLELNVLLKIERKERLRPRPPRLDARSFQKSRRARPTRPREFGPTW